MVAVCWCLTGWSEYFRSCRFIGILMYNRLLALQNDQKERKYPVSGKCVCLVDMRGQRRLGRLDDRKATLT